MKQSESEFSPVPGVRLGSTAAGIRYQDRDDLVVIEMAAGSNCAALFTRNRFCAAPVTLAREHLASAQPRYLLVNSGNANAGTGAAGVEGAQASCRALAALRGCSPQQVLPFSTGVIGEPLPVERLAVALPDALSALSERGWPAAARAIMTTDTVPKLVSRQVDFGDRPFTVTGMAKGSGMIRPDMATMLAYIATDLNLESGLLRQCLVQATNPSFNAISVDGDTSTNDAVVLIASAQSSWRPVDSADDPLYSALCEAVTSVCMELARSIVKDGEGATKLVEIAVEEAVSEEEAREVAFTIAHSPLVKTALFASDPNWGRILAAVGRADLPDLDIDKVELWLGDVCIVRNGGRAGDYTEAAGQAVMDLQEILIRVRLGRGEEEVRVLTCDLSYDYVKINADYRS